jgi:uncharacterized phage protein (TIGR02216 family)
LSAAPRRDPTPFPWREAMTFGLGALRHSPADFWRMTPRELSLAADGAQGRFAAPATRAALEALMRAHPDERT